MLFVDARSNVDKEALRTHVLNRLQNYLIRTQALLFGETEKEFWNDIHNFIGLIENEKKKEKWLAIERQIINLDKFIEGWISTAVESEERFEFFILSKAEEIGSGDQIKDYFWALQIRHDQLVALVEVIKPIISKLEKIIKTTPSDFFSDKEIADLDKVTIEDQIYNKAESINEERKKVV